MCKQKQEIDNRALDAVIRQNPGIRPARIARELNIARSTVMRRLPNLEEAGYHYAEDERGGLWLFTKQPLS